MLHVYSNVALWLLAIQLRKRFNSPKIICSFLSVLIQPCLHYNRVITAAVQTPLLLFWPTTTYFLHPALCKEVFIWRFDSWPSQDREIKTIHWRLMAEILKFENLTSCKAVTAELAAPPWRQRFFVFRPLIEPSLCFSTTFSERIWLNKTTGLV